MRGSIVVLALFVTPLVASVSQAQQRQNRPHWRRHDLPAAQHVERKGDDKKCEEKNRGNPSQTGLYHRADPRTKGNKDCDLGTSGGGTDQTPPPPPPPAPDPVGHTGVQ